MKLLKNKKIVILLLLTVFLITSGAKCGSAPSGLTPGDPPGVTLTYWKVWDSKSNLDPVFNQYRAMHPHISIRYRRLNYDEFDSELINALAEDRGPDIISVHVSWLSKYISKLQQMPPQIQMAYQKITGTIKKEHFTEIRTSSTPSLRDMRNLFTDEVIDKVYSNNKIYGLPLSVDSLALYVNRDLLNNAGIINPPKTWEEFKDQVITLTKQDRQGNLLQAGAAIGTAENIERAPDILSLLMMQNGAQMTNVAGRASFAAPAPNSTSKSWPAAEALDFYSSFASPAKQVYSWNEEMQNSLQAFMAGKVAFYFGYAYHLPTIQAQAPKLNFDIIETPKIDQPVNFANYWLEGVLKKSTHINEAWDLVLYMTTNTTANQSYLAASGKPPALKNLITAYEDDIYLAPFVQQLLTAKTWYKGNNADAVDEHFKEMMKNNLTGEFDSYILIENAVKKINLTTQ